MPNVQCVMSNFQSSIFNLMKIVILDAYALNPGDLDWSGIQALGEVDMYDRTAPEDVMVRCKGAEIVVTNKVPFDRERLQQLPNLRLIAVMATGYNIIDIDAAHELGITVCNIPAYSTASVAQMMMAQLLTITNRVEHYTKEITEQQSWAQSADFCYWNKPLIELQGKRLGIYGMGRIGMAASQIALAMGMEVLTISAKEESLLPQMTVSQMGETETLSVKKVDEETFWTTCDVYSLHCPLTTETKGLINKERINGMKHGAIVLNTSRGPVVEEQDVADALRTGQLSAFATDILSVEPATPDNPLLSAPNVFITPHIAWATLEARKRLMDILTENIRQFINGTPQNCV